MDRQSSRNPSTRHLGFPMRVATLLGVTLMLACSPQSKQMAGEGAASGAVAGAVGGMVSALVFGGDLGEGAARGAAWGASTGAVAGAMAGARADERQQAQREAQIQRQQAQREAQLERLKQEIGEDSFRGLEALADCKHEVALGYGRTAAQSNNRDHALAALWLEILTYADRREENRARALFPDLIAKDPKIRSDAHAEESMRKALQTLMDIRAEYGMARTCG